MAGPYDWAIQVESMRLAAAAWLALAEGREDEALATAASAAELDEKTGKHPVTPGAILPARELLADMLLEMGRPAEALAEYEASLREAPARSTASAGAARAAEPARARAAGRRAVRTPRDDGTGGAAAGGGRGAEVHGREPVTTGIVAPDAALRSFSGPA